MVAKHEKREYTSEAKTYLAKYKNLNNMLHWHYDCELIYVASGRLEVYANGENHILYEGQAMYIGNMEEHAIKTSTEADVYMFIFSYDMLKGLIKNQRLKSPVLSHGYDLVSLYGSIKTELQQRKKYYERTVENFIVDTIINIFRTEETIKADVSKKDKIAFMRLLDDIEIKFCYYTGDDAARFLCMSKTYFSKYFHKMSGLVFTDYLNAVRVSKAVQMLITDKEKTVGDIAGMCGFNTIRNFNRVFKEMTGFQPKELPSDFIFEDSIFFSSDSVAAGFDPTLRETVLIESIGGNAS